MTPILSICIPTYNRLDILRNTISSIYSDLNGVSLDDFEVVVSDNSKEHTTQPVIEEFKYENLHYYPTDCEGFRNSFFALSYGKGDYLKLNNNYTMFRKGTLRALIEQLKGLKDNKRQVIYTNGLRKIKDVAYYDTFDSYMAGLSYFCSWSAGYGMWREDFEKVKENMEIDKYFPQTSLLLSQNYKHNFAIDDRNLFDDQYVPKKGGYNIFKVFSVDFLNLVYGAYANGTISEKTYKEIKRDLLYKYLSVRYFKTVIARLDNFEYTGIKKNITIYYTKWQYILMLLVAACTPLIVLYRKIR